MTVITKRLKSKSMEIYLKGAPEVLKDVCDAGSCEFSALISEVSNVFSSPRRLRRPSLLLY